MESNGYGFGSKGRGSIPTKDLPNTWGVLDSKIRGSKSPEVSRLQFIIGVFLEEISLPCLR